MSTPTDERTAILALLRTRDEELAKVIERKPDDPVLLGRREELNYLMNIIELGQHQEIASVTGTPAPLAFFPIYDREEAAWLMWTLGASTARFFGRGDATHESMFTRLFTLAQRLCGLTR